MVHSVWGPLPGGTNGPMELAGNGLRTPAQAFLEAAEPDTQNSRFRTGRFLNHSEMGRTLVTTKSVLIDILLIYQNNIIIDNYIYNIIYHNIISFLQCSP